MSFYINFDQQPLKIQFHFIAYQKINFLIFQPKYDGWFTNLTKRSYAVGTQKNHLNETVLFEHPKHMLKLMGKKIFTILRSIFLLS